MNAFATTRRNAFAVFALVAAAFYALVHAVFLRHAELLERDLLLIALTIDLVLVVPSCFYWIVVRRSGLPRIAVLPVFVVCVALASVLLPADRQEPLRFAEFALLPIELGLAGWVFWRLATALRAAGRGESVDPFISIRVNLERLLGNRRLAAMAATELAMFWYAFASWRCRPALGEGVRAFSYHRRGGQLAVVIALSFLLIVETVALHLLVQRWSLLFAWLLSFGSLYCVIWLVANARAAALRPILLGERELCIRGGLGWCVDLALDDVDGVARHAPSPPTRAISAAYLRHPSHWILLKRERTLEGPYGSRRRARAIGIAPDDAGALVQALESRINT